MSAVSSSYQIPPVCAGKRTVKKVPFVEIQDGRIQGVVSSGSDIERVYVSFIELATGNYSCSTNNNRPCGGLRGAPCKHIMELVEEAEEEYGMERLAAMLGIEPGVGSTVHLLELRGAQVKDNVAVIFSRFLDYLRLTALKAPQRTLLEMNWF
ncbi:MAG: hypothetical protein V4726_09280 [Verrucomicrobiota bacterium]